MDKNINKQQTKNSQEEIQNITSYILDHSRNSTQIIQQCTSELGRYTGHNKFEAFLEMAHILILNDKVDEATAIGIGARIDGEGMQSFARLLETNGLNKEALSVLNLQNDTSDIQGDVTRLSNNIGKTIVEFAKNPTDVIEFISKESELDEKQLQHLINQLLAHGHPSEAEQAADFIEIKAVKIRIYETIGDYYSSKRKKEEAARLYRLAEELIKDVTGSTAAIAHRSKSLQDKIKKLKVPLR